MRQPTDSELYIASFIFAMTGAVLFLVGSLVGR